MSHGYHQVSHFFYKYCITPFVPTYISSFHFTEAILIRFLLKINTISTVGFGEYICIHIFSVIVFLCLQIIIADFHILTIVLLWCTQTDMKNVALKLFFKNSTVFSRFLFFCVRIFSTFSRKRRKHYLFFSFSFHPGAIFLMIPFFQRFFFFSQILSLSLLNSLTERGRQRCRKKQRKWLWERETETKWKKKWKSHTRTHILHIYFTAHNLSFFASFSKWFWTRNFFLFVMEHTPPFPLSFSTATSSPIFSMFLVILIILLFSHRCIVSMWMVCIEFPSSFPKNGI